MVLAKNTIRLRDIQTNIVNDRAVFNNIQHVCLSMHQCWPKSLKTIKVGTVKDLWYEYVEVSITHFTAVLCTEHITFLHVTLLYSRPVLNSTVLSFTVSKRLFANGC